MAGCTRNRFAIYASRILSNLTDTGRLSTIEDHVEETIKASDQLGAHRLDITDAASFDDWFCFYQA